ncbi:subtilisin-like serine protease [Chytridiales sp. JEL 0842]|nr:subtilisin-like serine protease [Chytridiales sp. JEL 0842]
MTLSLANHIFKRSNFSSYASFTMYIFNLITITIGALTQLTVAVPTPIQRAGAPIPNQYIVVFKNSTNPVTAVNHQAWLDTAARLGSARAPQFRRVDGVHYPDIQAFDAFTFLHNYTTRVGFNGYAARMSAGIAKSLRALPEVDFVEQDKVVTIGQQPLDPIIIEQKDAPWGLQRISQIDLPLDGSYSYSNGSAGAGVDVYVVDSGVFVDHPEFEGRARVGVSYSTDGNDLDELGHGTHVAGIIASKTYGVAKNANIISVKVLDKTNFGHNSDIIAGVDWATQQASNSGRKSVVNMSLGDVTTPAMDRAVAAAIQSGVTVVVAAMNDFGSDACDVSPARLPEAITVAASDINDNFADFSNLGSCVDIIAPGVKILSTWKDGSTRLLSGTSMATPHVSGIVVAGMSAGKITDPASALAYLISTGVKDKIVGVSNSTVNLLAQVEL